MKCQRTACGREIQEDALYCPYCGKKQQRTVAPKPRKRANGKGCIYRCGKTWTIQVRVVRNGTVVYARKKCGFPTRAAAEEYLDTYTRTGVAPRSMRLIDCWTALQQTKKVAGAQQGQAQPLRHRMAQAGADPDAGCRADTI